MAAPENAFQESAKRVTDVSQIIADYIDKAITTPPTHQPFQSEPPFDLSKPYERREDDPAWLQSYSDQAVNLVRRVLEFAILYIPGSVRVHLRDLVHEEFVDILHNCLKTKQPREVRVDDPAWLLLYTHEEINQVRVVLESRRPEALDFEDISHRVFDDIVDAYARSARQRASSPVVEDLMQNIKAHLNIKPKDEGDYEDDDETVNGDDEDIQDDSDESDHDGSIWDDDTTSDLDMDEINLAFGRWDRNELEEGLPPDTISPLLGSPATQKVVLDVLEEYLGIPQGPVSEVKIRLEAILHDLRRRFRVAHTPPFLYTSLPNFSHKETSVTSGYLTLASAVYTMRALNRPELLNTSPQSMNTVYHDMISNLKRVEKTKHWMATMQHDTSLDALSQRARAYRLRLTLFMRARGQADNLALKMSGAYKQRGSKKGTKHVVKPSGALALRKAVEEFVRFEANELDKYSVGFPDSLIKDSTILTILLLIRDMECAAEELERNKDTKVASEIAGFLLEKWRLRSSRSTPHSLYVSL